MSKYSLVLSGTEPHPRQFQSREQQGIVHSQTLTLFAINGICDNIFMYSLEMIVTLPSEQSHTVTWSNWTFIKKVNGPLVLWYQMYQICSRNICKYMIFSIFPMFTYLFTIYLPPTYLCLRYLSSIYFSPVYHLPYSCFLFTSFPSSSLTLLSLINLLPS